jgi:hypothetical protein
LVKYGVYDGNKEFFKNDLELLSNFERTNGCCGQNYSIDGNNTYLVDLNVDNIDLSYDILDLYYKQFHSEYITKTLSDEICDTCKVIIPPSKCYNRTFVSIPKYVVFAIVGVKEEFKSKLNFPFQITMEEFFKNKIKIKKQKNYKSNDIFQLKGILCHDFFENVIQPNGIIHYNCWTKRNSNWLFFNDNKMVSYNSDEEAKLHIKYNQVCGLIYERNVLSELSSTNTLTNNKQFPVVPLFSKQIDSSGMYLFFYYND